MSQIIFPSNPADGQKYSVGRTTWTWSDSRQSWTSQLDGGSYNNPLYVSNAASFGNTSIQGTLTVSSDFSIGANVGVIGALTVQGNTTLSGAKTLISGNTTFLANVVANNTLYVGANAIVNGSLLINDRLTVTNTSLFSNNVVITGNLIVTGTTTIVNTNIFEVSDNIVVLNADATGSPVDNVGFEVNRADGANVSLLWDESTDRWALGNTYITGLATVVGNAALQSNVSITKQLSVTGNTVMSANASVGDTLSVSANGVVFADGSRQTAYLDPIVYAIALGG